MEAFIWLVVDSKLFLFVSFLLWLVINDLQYDLNMKSCDNPYLVRFCTGPPTGPLYNNPEDDPSDGPNVGELDTMGMIEQTRTTLAALLEDMEFIIEPLGNVDDSDHQYYIDQISILANNIEILESKNVDEEIIKELTDSFNQLVSALNVALRGVYKLDDI